MKIKIIYLYLQINTIIFNNNNDFLKHLSKVFILKSKSKIFIDICSMRYVFVLQYSVFFFFVFTPETGPYGFYHQHFDHNIKSTE